MFVNIQKLLTLWLPEKKSAHRVALRAAICHGIRTEDIRLLFSEKHISSATLKRAKALSKDLKFLNTELFAQAEIHGVSRPKVSELEKEVTKRFVKQLLSGKSGSNHATHYCTCEKQDLVNHYKDNYAEIRKAVEARGCHQVHCGT
jgi:hypothetical protein